MHTDAGVCSRGSSPVVTTSQANMVRLELDQVVMRRMKEDEIEVVKALIKVGAVKSHRLLPARWGFAAF